MLLEDGPAAPGEAWLGSHRWVWSRERLEELVARGDQPTFVCGIALNLEEVVDLFEAIFLLHIDEATQEERLVAHDAHNPRGRSEAGREEIRAGRPIFEAEMQALGAIVLDGAQAASEVAEEIVARVGHHLR